jgi:ribonuclease P protein component
MLKKTSRVRASSFNQLLHATRSLHGRFVSISYGRIDSPMSKCAVIASKAVAKQAVARNKLRRWGYALLREFGLHERKNLACFIFFKKGSKDVLNRELKNELGELFKKAGLVA